MHTVSCRKEALEAAPAPQVLKPLRGAGETPAPPELPSLSPKGKLITMGTTFSVPGVGTPKELAPPTPGRSQLGSICPTPLPQIFPRPLPCTYPESASVSRPPLPAGCYGNRRGWDSRGIFGDLLHSRRPEGEGQLCSTGEAPTRRPCPTWSPPTPPRGRVSAADTQRGTVEWKDGQGWEVP